MSRISNEDKLVQQELEKQRRREAKKRKSSNQSIPRKTQAAPQPAKDPKQVKREEIQNQKRIKQEERKMNHEIVRTTSFFAVLFFAMVCYYVYLISFDSQTIINNSYNKRLASYANTITRGNIYTADNEKIAYTSTDDKGVETRVYPYDETFAHVVGMNTVDRGKTGIEKMCDYYMLTSNINPILKAVNEFKKQKSLGNDVITTLDSNIQQVAYDSLSSNDGAVVVMDSKTGAILSMVSKPDYNPNDLESLWDEIDNDKNSDGKKEGSFLLNRATQGLYTPGSIFKIFTSLEFLRQNDYNDEFSFDCDGVETIANYPIKCYNSHAHGHENLADAFANSCNGAFATIGTQLDMNRMNEDLKTLLFNSKLPLEIEYSKSKFNLNNDSSTFDITQSAIGQGTTVVTPIHMAMIVQAIANDGMMMKPYLVSQIRGYDGATVKKFESTQYKRMFTKKESSMLREYMDGVVERGTGIILNNQNYECGGKTGTAQIDSNNNVNSWFVGYGTKNGRSITVSVVIENVQDGSVKAVECAKTILDECFK